MNCPSSSDNLFRLVRTFPVQAVEFEAIPFVNDKVSQMRFSRIGIARSFESQATGRTLKRTTYGSSSGKTRGFHPHNTHLVLLKPRSSGTTSSSNRRTDLPFGYDGP